MALNLWYTQRRLNMKREKKTKQPKPPKKRSLLRKILISILICFTSFFLATAVINIGMILSARKYIYTDISSIPPRSTVLVLGSQSIGTRLSPVLEDRVVGGINLMESSKGGKLLLSGHHELPFYSEVAAMQLYVATNAPFMKEEDILLDYAGYNTWDSMYRARDVFKVEDLIIVTKEFHISRAVSMARSLGMNAIGYSVNQERFVGQSLRNWRFREYFARVKGLYSIVFKPAPRYLGEYFPLED